MTDRVVGHPLEAERIAALERYGLAKGEAASGLDDIASLAGSICETPVALVTLLGEKQQFFSAAVGTTLCGTPLERSICVHTLGSADLLVIPDLSVDPRTRDNPLVTEAPHVRFYAGAPLVAENGVTLGTLCVLDFAPRPDGLTPKQAKSLRSLASQVMTQFELRRNLCEREADRRLAQADATRLDTLIALQRAAASGTVALEAIFQAVVDCALDIVEAADGAVVEIRRGDELVYEAVSGNLAAHKGTRISLAGSLSGRAIHEERPFLCADVENEPTVDRELVRRFDIRSMIVVPVTRRGLPIGVLKVQASRTNAFSIRHLAVAQMLAGVVASAAGDAAEAASQRNLREAENRYRQTFASVTEFAVIVTDREGRITEWNTGAERILGWTAEEMRGTDAARFFTPEDRAIGRVAVEMGDALREGRAVDERWHLKKGGGRFYASGNMMPLIGDDGEHLGFIKILRDRTSQREAEQSLQKAREQFSLAVEAADLGIFDYDLLTGELGWDLRARQLFGLPRDRSVSYAAFLEALHPDDHDWVDAAVRAALDPAGSGNYDIEYRIRDMTDGTGRWIAAKGQAFFANRRAVRFIGTVRDITANRTAEAAMRESQHQLEVERGLLQAVVQQAPLGISIAYADGRGQINMRLEQMLGHDAGIGDGGGHASFDALHPDGTPYRMDEYPTVRALRNGETLIDEPMSYRDAQTGDVRRWEVSTTPVRDSEGHILAAVSIILDVEDRRRAEEQRAILNRELSHRLKNTLAIVSSIATQTLRTASDVGTAKRTLSERINALSKAHDILLTGHRDAASIAEIVRSAVALHNDGGRIAVEGPDVQLGSKYSLALSLIVHELSTNAVKYGALSQPEGRVLATWSIAPSPESGDALLLFDWIEADGPPVAEPTRRSFGTRLIEMGLAGAAEGSSHISYAPEGVRCRITAALSEIVAED
ncbi:PAS domain S-box protein [Aureimonas psammosilenae]|uniref:PAS domain S-box protein n=1 Tax=Aureimonas psammosilenae TaxID=2495496 RepID=UPI00186983F8|nr:PAS domain S-box protein [Aureimonas psammosilenae]